MVKIQKEDGAWEVRIYDDPTPVRTDSGFTLRRFDILKDALDVLTVHEDRK